MLHASQFVTVGIIASIVFPGPAQAVHGSINALHNPPWSEWELPTQIIVKVMPPREFSAQALLSVDSLAIRTGQATDLPVEPVRSQGDLRILNFGKKLTEEEIDTVLKQVSALDGVLAVEEDEVYQATYVPTDPDYLPMQWSLHDEFGINIESAWDTTAGDPNLVIAVLDTGYTDHPEFQDRILPGYDFVHMVGTSTYVAADGDGRDADAHDPGYSNWHGTATTGLIGALSDNEQGIAGVVRYTRILPVRVLGRGGGYKSDIVDGLRWAVGLHVDEIPDNPNPARVVNMSLASENQSYCTNPDNTIDLYQKAINEAITLGSVIIVSAGNKNLDASQYSPGNCEHVITVAATDELGDRWVSNTTSGSNFGADIAISAPGNSIYTTSNDGYAVLGIPDYITYTGTSMSAPLVSGVTALILSIRPDLDYFGIRHVIQETAQNFPEGSTCQPALCGPGILDAATAVQIAEIHVNGFSPQSISTDRDTTIQVTGSNFPDGPFIKIGSTLFVTQAGTASELSLVVPSKSLVEGDYTIQVCTSGEIMCSYPEADYLSVIGPLFLPVVARAHLTN